VHRHFKRQTPIRVELNVPPSWEAVGLTGGLPFERSIENLKDLNQSPNPWHLPLYLVFWFFSSCMSSA